MADTNQSSQEQPVAVDSAENRSFQDSQPKFSEAERDLVARIYKLVGQRWSLIAGRIPGRTAVEVEKYWRSEYENGGEK